MGYTITGQEKLIHVKSQLSKVEKTKKIINIGGTQHDLKFLESLGFSNVIISNNSKKELENCENKSILFDITKELPKNLIGQFDIVISMDVVEHLVNPDFAIVNFGKLLKPKGTLIITTPNLASFFNRLFLLFGWSLPNYHPSFIKTGNPLMKAKISTNFRNSFAHKSVFTASQLKELLNLYGFKILTHKGYDYSSKTSLQGGGNYRKIRKIFNKILPASLNEGIFITCKKQKTIEIQELIDKFTIK